MKVHDALDKQGSVGRRSLLRGGAVLAGAGLAGTALAQPASAAPIDYVKLGGENSETTATALTVNAPNGDKAVSALRLSNAAGPSLYLEPIDQAWDLTLKVGEIANTEVGPVIGVQDPADIQGPPTTTRLATLIDLSYLPTPIAVQPERLLDTRTAAGRQGLIRSSINAFDSDFRLKPGAWVDILVAPAGAGFFLPSIFVNLTAVGALGTGFVAIYPPGDYPGTSTLNVVTGQTVANSAFVAVQEVSPYYAVRVYTTAACWIIVDISGAMIQGFPDVATGGRQAAGSRVSIAQRLLAKIGRRR